MTAMLRVSIAWTQRADNEELEVVLSDVPNPDSVVELLNRGDQPDLPILVQSTNRVPTPMRLEHLFLNAAPTTCEGFCEEGRESPACLGDREYSTVPFRHLSPPIHVNNRQTRSMSQSSLTAVAPTSAEKLTESEQRVQELQAQLDAAQAEIDTLRTHCYFSSGVISCQQKQLYSRDAKKRGSGRAKKINVEARVLTSQEGRQELQQLREDTQSKEQRRQQDLAQKAVGDEAQRKHRADPTRTLVGPLNKSRRKEDLEDIAVALALLESGKKDEIFERITMHFERHLGLKSDPRFEGLFNSRHTKRPRTDNAPVAGPSSLHTIVPNMVPGFSLPLPNGNTVPTGIASESSSMHPPTYYNAYLEYIRPSQSRSA
jgi:hypothetical protein